MKQLIVMLSTVLLGIVIAGLVISFGGKAETIGNNVMTNVGTYFDDQSDAVFK